MNRVLEYLAEIRELAGFKNAILCGITLSKREDSAEFFLVTDKTYSAMDEARAREICEKYLPQGMTAKTKIVKRVPDAETIRARILEYIRKSFPAAGAFLEDNAVEVEMLSSGANFFVDIAAG